jgi:PAS domain S-box-containing protein
MIGEFTGADRSYVFQFSDDRETVSNTHEWCRQGVEPAMAHLQALGVESLPWILARHQQGETIHIPRVADLPPEAQAERWLFESQDIQSLLCVPMACAEKLLGFVGLDSVLTERTWPEKTAVLLRFVGEILANALERKRSKEALLQSEERFRGLVESTSDWVWEVDPDGRYTYSSPNVKDLLGYEVEEVLGKTPFDLMPPEEAVRARVIIQSLVVRREPLVREENVNLHKDGRRVVLETSGVPVFRPDGSLRGYRGIDRDITGRKEAEEALRASEANYREIFDAANDAIVVHDAETGRIVDVNRTTCEMLGCGRDEMIGRSVEDFGADEAPVARDEVASWMRKAMVRPQLFEWQCKRKDGRLLWVEVHLRRVEIRGEARVLAIVRDITERKAAAEALRALEANYREIFNAANDAIFIHAMPTGEILDCNEKGCEMFGYTREEICRATIEDLSFGQPPYKQADAERWLKQAAEGQPVVFEWRTRHSSGALFWVEISLKRATIGGQLRVLAVVRDITARKREEQERRRLEAQIQHAQKLESLGVLAGGIAHDFNNLPVAVMGNADLALLDVPPPSPARETIEEIKKAAIRASELTNQMLAYSGRGQFEVAAVNLNELIEEMTHLLEVSVSKKIALRKHFGGGLPAIEADAAQIRQVVMNLITNASEAIGEAEGVIAIHTGVTEIARPSPGEADLDGLRKGRYVFLEVADTGCGMDKRTKARIFEPFFSTKFTGRGLGLAAVLGIVRGHGGAMKIDSEVGKGTTFRVLLPVGTQKEAPAAVAEETQPARVWHAPGTVLLVDDEQSVRKVGRAMLERIGFTVLTATDGRDGVAAFRQHADEIAVVLLDMTMPGLNGEEAFRAIREIRGDVPVLLCSGYNEQDATNRFRGQGLAGFIQKPFELDHLADKLREVLEP